MKIFVVFIVYNTVIIIIFFFVFKRFSNDVSNRPAKIFAKNKHINHYAHSKKKEASLKT